MKVLFVNHTGIVSGAEHSLLEDLADETLVNNQGLARKDPLFIGALALLVLAVLLELTGVQ